MSEEKPGDDRPTTDDRADEATDRARDDAVEERRTGEVGGEEVGGGDEPEEQIAYELDGWTKEARGLVGRLLEGEGVPHAWEGGTLVVPAGFEEAVDHLVEQVDLGSGLDPDEEQIVFELDEWTDEQRDELVEALIVEGIPYEWDEEGGLAVGEKDEARVDDLLNAIEYPDALAVDEGEEDGGGESEGGDGLLVQDTLSELFVAADRLTHDPEDHEGVLSLVDAARLVVTLPLPFGFDKATWESILARVSALRQTLEGEADDDEVLDRARALRTLLRQYV